MASSHSAEDFIPKKVVHENVNGVRADISKALSAVKVSELELKQHAVILDASTDPRKAIEILVKNKVRAAPVLDQNEFVGVLDLRDTLKYVLEAYSAAFEPDEEDELDDSKQNNNNSANVNLANAAKMGANMKAMSKPLTKSATKTSAMDYLLGSSSSMSSKSLSALCNHNPFRIVNETDSLLHLSSVFAMGSHVVGVAKDKKLNGVITQGQFFQAVAKRWQFDNECTLNELWKTNYIVHPVKSVSRTTKAVESFKLMNELGLSGLAVVNENGILIHNTSATDVKLWLLKGSQSLDDSIETFLINIRNLSLMERYPITVCQLHDSLKRAIQKLQATKYHRLWIVDEKTEPIGVLSLTDIFRFIVGTYEKQEEQAQNDANGNDKEENDEKDSK